MKLDWRVRGLRVLIVTALVWVTCRAAGLAQGDGFKPFQPGQQETLAASPLVLAAYAFVWVALLAYVFLLWQRIGRVEHELAEVNAKLSARKRP
jgi:CcmD family protein